eukprot:197755-Prymnesium_polylepis.1
MRSPPPVDARDKHVVVEAYPGVPCTIVLPCPCPVCSHVTPTMRPPVRAIRSTDGTLREHRAAWTEKRRCGVGDELELIAAALSKVSKLPPAVDVAFVAHVCEQIVVDWRAQHRIIVHAPRPVITEAVECIKHGDAVEPDHVKVACRPVLARSD